jgi:glutaredoxin
MSSTTQQSNLSDSDPKKAILYRMVMEKHLCPYGLKSKWLLQRHGYQVEDNKLTNDKQTDEFRAKHNVKTTPQAFIGDERIGGYEALREHLTDWKKDSEKITYTPVLVIFTVCALTAMAVSWSAFGTVLSIRAIEWFAAFSMSMLAVQKLRDVENFSTMFLNYDLLAQRWVTYGYLYAFGEGAAAVAMVAGGIIGVLASPIALFIGTVGTISVIKAVYVDKRELKCACVGGDSNVPLGFISLTENLVMMAMGIWMPVHYFLL